MAILKDARQLGCVFQDIEPPESLSILREGSKVLGSIRRVRFTRTLLRQANIRENKGPSLGQIQVQIPHQRSPYALNLRLNLRRRLKDRRMYPRRRVEIGQEYLKAQRNGHSYLQLTYQRMVSPNAIRTKTGGKRICCRFRSIHA